MYLYSELQKKAATGDAIRVCLIGAGKFGSMFLSQVVTTIGLKVTTIADLNPDRSRLTCKTIGWSDEQIESTDFSDDALASIRRDDIDVVVERPSTLRSKTRSRSI